MSANEGSASNGKPTWLAAFQNRFGPASIIGMTIMGPGTIAAVLTAASGWQYSMVWAVLFSATFAVLGMHMAVRVAGANEETSLETVSRVIHPALAWIFALIILGAQFCVAMAEGNALASVGQAMFSASSGGILPFDIPNFLLAIVLVVLVCVVYYFKKDFGFISTFAWATLAFMAFCFLLTMFVAGPDWGQVFKNVVPHWPPSVESHRPLAIAPAVLAGIIGGSFGLYSFVFHPYMIKEKGWLKPDKVKLAFWDTFWSCGVMYGLFAFTLFVTFGTVLYVQGLTPRGIGGAAETLRPLMGDFGYLVFVLGWFGAVFTTTAGCVWTGVTPICELLGIEPTLKNPKFRGVLVGFAVVVAGIIGPAFGPAKAFGLLSWAMGILGLTGPIGVITWLYLGNKKSVMKGEKTYNWVINVLAVLCLIATTWIAYYAGHQLLTKMGVG